MTGGVFLVTLRQEAVFWDHTGTDSLSSIHPLLLFLLLVLSCLSAVYQCIRGDLISRVDGANVIASSGKYGGLRVASKGPRAAVVIRYSDR